MAWSFSRFSYIFALTLEKTGCLVHYAGINVHTYRHLLVTKLGICYATCPCNMYYFEIHVLVYCLFLLHHLNQEASYSCTWWKTERLLFSLNCIFFNLYPVKKWEQGKMSTCSVHSDSNKFASLCFAWIKHPSRSSFFSAENRDILIKDNIFSSPYIAGL